MRYDKVERRAIKSLDQVGLELFRILEQVEKGKFVAVPELCRAICNGPTFILFSCLSGSRKGEELGESLGALFDTRLRAATLRVQERLRGAGYNSPLTIIIDDTEPNRVWRWHTSQNISEWCRLLVESIDIPLGWRIVLWSDLEVGQSVNFEEVLKEISKPTHALIVSRHLDYMREFPNKKLVGDIRCAAFRRVAHYALQGSILEKQIPNAVLLQSETPWAVKDLIYQPLRGQPLPIAHPYSVSKERR